MSEGTRTVAAVLFGNFRRVFKSGVGRTSMVVFSGSLVSAACGFVVNILFAKNLGPAHYGLLASCLVFMNLCIQISDFGTGKSIVRLSSGGHEFGLSKKEIYSASLLFRLAAAVVISAMVYIFSGFIGATFLKNPELVQYIRISGVGILVGGVGQTFLSILQEQEKFFFYSADKVVMAVLKIALLGAIIAAAGLTVTNAIWITTIAIGAGAAFAFFIMPGGNFSWASVSMKAFSKMFTYARWIAIVQIAGILMMNAPVIILTRYSTPEQVGFYTATFNIALGFSLLAASLTVVLLPRYSKIQGHSEIKRLNRKVTRTLSVFIVPSLLIIFYSGDIMRLLYGRYYADAGIILSVSILSALIDLYFISYSTLLYRIRKIHYVSVEAVLRLVLLVVLGIFLTQRYDAFGIALAVLITRAVASLYTVVVVRRCFNSLEGI